MASLSSHWDSAFVASGNDSDNCSLMNCPNFTRSYDLCDQILRTSGADAIAGLRLVASLLSIIGSLSIITSVLYHKRIRSYEVFPIFMLAWADMLLSVFFVVGSAYWYYPAKHKHIAGVMYLCLATSLCTTVLTLVSTNLTVVYALSLCLRMKLRAAREMKAAQWMTKRVFVVVLVVAYVISWCTPVVIITPQYFVNDPFWRCAHDCSCGCKLSYLNIFPELDWTALTGGRYFHAARNQYLELAVTLTAHYTIDLTLLMVLYGILMQSMFCSKKGRLQRIGDELIISDSPERFREMSCRAVSRILSYFTIFVLCGIANVIVSCFLLYHFSSNKFCIPEPRRMALLVIQAVTLPLQGFCNALVYGWSRQMFRTEVLDDRTPLISPAERQDREREEESFRQVRGRGGKTENRRYTSNIH